MNETPRKKITTERSGHCLCSAVRITAHEAENKVGACHCAMCRRWGGGPFMEINCGTQVSIEGEENVTTYDSSPWAERAFCKKCGSHLFYRLKGTKEHMVLAGIFENTDDVEFKTQVFIDEKPAFYSFAEKTNNLTGPELFEMVKKAQQNNPS